LKDLPSEIVMLKALTVLAIQGNQITHLPVEIGFMSQLLAFKWNDNPLIQPPHSLLEHVFQPIARLQVGLENEIVSIQRKGLVLDRMREDHLIIRLLRAFLLALALKRRDNGELMDRLYSQSSCLYLCTVCGTVQVEESGNKGRSNIIHGLDIMHALQVVRETKYDLFRKEITNHIREKTEGRQDRVITTMYKMEKYSISRLNEEHCGSC
jgi:Leucine-rich repeat (LRR) protein